MSENQMTKMTSSDCNPADKCGKRPIHLRAQSSNDLTPTRSVTGNLWMEERITNRTSVGQEQRTRSFSAASHSTATVANEWKDDGVRMREERVRRRLCSMRNWEYTQLGKQLAKQKHNHQDVQFTVLSYNVLAQELLEEHTYLYKRVEPDALMWEKRAGRILREVVDCDADVLCLQEVQASHYDTFFTPQLSKLGFEGIYKKRTGDKPDGCAIFWRQTKFDLKGSKSVEYWKPNVQILDRDNIALIALLTPKTTSKSKRNKLDSSISNNPGTQDPYICVATTHLLYNPKRHDIKLAQLQMLFAELDHIAYHQSGSSATKSHVYHPVILTGDFNLTPDTSAYQFITKGALQYEGLGRDLNPSFRGQVLNKELIPRHLNVTDQCQHLDVTLKRYQESPSKTEETDSAEISAKFASGELSHQLKFQSVYPHVLHRLRGAQEVTTYQNDWVTVDYIFYNTEQTNSPLRLLSRLGLLAGKEMGIVGGLPSLASPSDHMPLAASFIWHYDEAR